MTVALRRGRGSRPFNVPAGSLAAYYAAMAAHASQRVEILVEGDSTWAGQVTSGTNYYSPATRLRELILAAGYTDGGHGWNNGEFDTPHVSGEVASGISGTPTGFATDDGFLLPGALHKSIAGADTVTYQGYGTHIRLWYRRYTFGGRFTYSVDGGAAVTVEGTAPNVGGVASYHFIDIDGLAEGLHTVAFVNSGGRVIPKPNPNGSGAQATGSGTSNPYTPSGTYYYKFTSVGSLGGESLPTAAYGPVTVFSSGTPNGNVIQGLFINATGIASYNIYRSTSSGGTYGLVASAAAGAGTFGGNWTDTSSSPGVAPPTVSTIGLDTNSKDVNVAIEVFRNAGVIIHNQAVRGGGSSHAERGMEMWFGLAQDSTGLVGDSAIQPLDASTGARRISLAIHSTGINDQQGTGTTDTSATTFANTVAFIRSAKHAGASVLVCIPALTSANQKQKAGIYRQALVDAADQESVAWVDLGIFGAFIGTSFGGTDPHLSEAQYITQGDYLWSKVLNPALAYA